MKLKSILIILFLAFLLIGSASAYTIDSDIVYINETWGKLEAYPHTLHSSGWVYFNATPYQDFGELDFYWGFDTASVKPTKAEFYSPHYVNWTTQHSQFFYNVTSFEVTEEACVYGNDYNPTHRNGTYQVCSDWDEEECIDYETISSIVCFDSYEVEGNNYTIYWHTNHTRIDDWMQVNTFQLGHTVRDFEGYNEWWHIDNFTVEVDKTYRARAYVEIPITREVTSGKYYFAVKRTSETLDEAIAAGHFMALDPWYDSQYFYRNTVTITHVNSSGSTLTHFPSYVNVSFIPGKMQSDYDDVVFTDTGDNLLPFELENYNALYADYWVNTTIPNTDLDIYMYYGNAEATSVADPEGVWNSDYRMIQHLNESPANGTAGHIDSTSYDNDGTPYDFNDTSNSTTDATGYIDGADRFDGTNDYVDCGNDASLDITDEITIDTWMKMDTMAAGYRPLVKKVQKYRLYTSSYHVAFDFQDNNSQWSLLQSPSVLSLDTWHYVVGTFEYATSGNNTKLYVNGIKVNEEARNNVTIILDGTDLYIGWMNISARYFNGTIDEVRISSVARSADWINQTYQLMSNQSTFVTFGAEEKLYNISGYVTNATGTPIENAYVVNNITSSTNYTNASGYYVLTVPNDTYLVSVNKSLYILNSTIVTVNGADVTNQNITLIESGPPAITLLSQDPVEIYQNSTGNFNATWQIVHDSAGLNTSSIALVWTTWNTSSGSYNHSLRVPSNNRSAYYDPIGEWILRADNRNDTITGGDVYSYAGADENNTRMTVESINDSYTLVHWNGTLHDTVWVNTWHLDRTEQQSASMTEYKIWKDQSLLVKVWDLEKIEGNAGYIVSMFGDTAITGIAPSIDLDMYYLPDTYDPDGAVAPEDSPSVFYITSHNASTWVNTTYETPDSNYTNLFFIKTHPTESIATDTGYVYFKSNVPEAMSYSINVTDSPTSTNRTFGECDVTWIGESFAWDGFTEYPYTTNTFSIYQSNNRRFQFKMFAADNSDNWGNSSLNYTDIGIAYFPPTRPSVILFHYPTIYYDDYDMNGTYSNGFIIGVGVGRDPDGGSVAHNLTLHYANGTYVATINNTFTDAAATHGVDGVHADISFDAVPYYSSEEYTLRVVAEDDENNTIESWLGINFTLGVETVVITSKVGSSWVNWSWDSNLEFQCWVDGEHKFNTSSGTLILSELKPREQHTITLFRDGVIAGQNTTRTFYPISLFYVLFILAIMLLLLTVFIRIELLSVTFGALGFVVAILCFYLSYPLYLYLFSFLCIGIGVICLLWILMTCFSMTGGGFDDEDDMEERRRVTFFARRR